MAVGILNRLQWQSSEYRDSSCVIRATIALLVLGIGYSSFVLNIELPLVSLGPR
jgi:hypothetical protein